jgi:hypothetical protein
MKWMMLLIACIVVAVMLFLGLRLIGSGESELNNETLITPEYNATSGIVNTILVGSMGIPAALGVIAFIFVMVWLVKEVV